MPTVYQGFKPIDMTDEEYAVYMRNFVNPQVNPNDNPGSMPALETNAQGGLSPVSQEPKAGTLESYYGNYEPDMYGQIGQHATATGVSTIAGAATHGVGGLWLGIAEAIRSGVHGGSWTPDKYKTLTEAGRKHYLDPNAEHRNPTNRARDLSEMSQMNPNDNPRLIKYLSRVQPYEDMAYFNPDNMDYAGKMRAYGNTEWAKQRILNRWQSDMDAMEAQDLAEKYGLNLPEHLKNRGPFKVDYSRGY